MVGFAEKLNVQYCGNSTGNYAHYMSGMSGFAEKLNIPNSEKFNGKLCTLFMYGQSIFAKKLKVQKNGNSISNCVQYMYGMFGFAEKLIQNCVNSTENCVHYFCTECLDLQKI